MNILQPSHLIRCSIDSVYARDAILKRNYKIQINHIECQLSADNKN